MPQPWTIRREVDLERDFVGVERIAALATTSAKAAHELRIAVKSGSKTVDMDGASVLLNLILPDGISTTADGSIEAGACIAMLPPLCYQRGETRGVLLLQFGTQASIPVYAFVLRCFEDLTDAFADPDHVIPSLAEILAQLDSAKAAAKAAQDGAGAANDAAGAADAAAGNATAAAKSANNAASAANKAAQKANAAAARLDGMTATATGLPAGSAPTVAVTTGDDGAKRLDFGIPKGDKGETGATPQLTVNVTTGEPGTEASVSQSGTAEKPVIDLTIPRGNTGDIGALKINGKAPDASGAVTLEAGDVGALGASATAADASKLGGKLPAEYASAAVAAAHEASIGDAWTSGKTYAVGDYCISGNQLYKCKAAHTAGSAVSAAYWDAVNMAGEVKSKFDSKHFGFVRFDEGGTYRIEIDDNYNAAAIIFGCDGYGAGILITYGNGYISRLHVTNNVEVTGPTSSDNYRYVTIKNTLTVGNGYLGVIALGKSVSITRIE